MMVMMCIMAQCWRHRFRLLITVMLGASLALVRVLVRVREQEQEQVERRVPSNVIFQSASFVTLRVYQCRFGVQAPPPSPDVGGCAC